MNAVAVIGAGFGDEGKGHVTEYLCSKNPRETLVVRFNGGAQAGHTVEMPSGQRHVFHHFGSGTLHGCPTHLTSDFIVNPLLWKKEWIELGARPFPFFVDDGAMVTTPYDMLLNQEAERLRGGDRHGSCGVGVNETVERHEQSYETTVTDLWNIRDLYEKLIEIRKHYVLARLQQLVPECEPSKTFLERLTSPAILKSFLETCRDFTEQAIPTSGMPRLFPGAADPLRERVVFEGAQGLLLDQHHRFFPHVTRSSTGLPNVIRALRRSDISSLEVVYVLRPYMTRHGAGPFPTEDPTLSYPDATNAPNDWQGSLRFGRLDYPLISRALVTDLRAIPKSIKARVSLAVTCLDHVEDPTHRVDELRANIGLPVSLVSFGPTAGHVAHLDQPVDLGELVVTTSKRAAVGGG